MGITTEAQPLDADMGDWETFLHFLYLCVYYSMCKCVFVCYHLFNQEQESDSHGEACTVNMH